MKWRILLELTETTGSVQTREMVTGDRPTNVISPKSIGLSLAESKCRITRLHQLRGLSGAKPLKSLGRHIKSRHYMGERSRDFLDVSSHDFRRRLSRQFELQLSKQER
jgi:hypothetical protein